MYLQLNNNKAVIIRRPAEADAEQLFHYFQQLSAETKSRFRPHPFDRDTTGYICNERANDLLPWIGIDANSGRIIAYMLVKKGMLEGDQRRYAERQFFADNSTTATFAPSVADDWQGAGVGKLMNKYIEEELRKERIKLVVLWGGVQADNDKAVHFYRGQGYISAGSFWHNDRNNYDMLKFL
jgi:ribosomal protein S18 acetylase RimI-like enzyme